MDKRYISENKRVILITGDDSKWYEQAIFIVKKNAAEKGRQTDFVREAEQIIQNYMNGLTARTQKTEEQPQPIAAHARRRKSKTDIIINVVIIAACVAIMLMLSRGILLNR